MWHCLNRDRTQTEIEIEIGLLLEPWNDVPNHHATSSRGKWLHFSKRAFYLSIARLQTFLFSVSVQLRWKSPYDVTSHFHHIDDSAFSPREARPLKRNPTLDAPIPSNCASPPSKPQNAKCPCRISHACPNRLSLTPLDKEQIGPIATGLSSRVPVL